MQKGAAFATYANVCVQNAIVLGGARGGRSKHAPLNTLGALYRDGEHPGPEELVMQSESAIHRRCRASTHGFRHLEKQVLALFPGRQFLQRHCKAAECERKSCG